MSGLTFFDLESTGTEPERDRIIQYAFISDGEGTTGLVNPGCPIPAEVTALTGIDDAAVKHAPPFAELAERIAKLIDWQPLCGFNCSRFDVPLLAEEFERAKVDYRFGPIIDLDPLFKQHHPRNLSAAVRTYLGREHDGAHRADADALAARQVYHAMLAQWDRLQGLSIEELAKLSAYDRPFADPAGHLHLIDGVICYAHRKVRGVPVEDDPGYARWILDRDFPASTKRVLVRELERIEAERGKAQPALFDSDPDAPW